MNKLIQWIDDSLRCIFKTQFRAIGFVTVFVMLSGNITLFKKILEIYPVNAHNGFFLISLAGFFTALTALLVMLTSFGKMGRAIIAIWVLLTAQAAYYMDTFGVLIDTVMIDNILHTDFKEITGLLTVDLLMRLTIFGVIPAWIIIRYWPSVSSVRQAIQQRILAVIGVLFFLVMMVVPFSAGYATFIREHKIARLYANPTYPIYSAIKYGSLHLTSNDPHRELKKIAEDAKLLGQHSRHELIVLVVGETARYDRFSLNGYTRQTNPRLSQEQVISFSHVSSCGTSTGVSVPCMFSALGREEYDKDKALGQENAVDVLVDHGVAVLWRDNNSNSKGVATRISYEDFQSPTYNPVCDKECRDIGMLSRLDDYVASHRDQDILIILHQMGNHGPEYYRRYPSDFRKFQPECMTGELKECTRQEVDNSYDNAILYTDYFLGETIRFLKKYDNDYETAMLYVSDHGESLGEHGVYLHAAPYAIAPEEQTHVPAILWLGQHFDYKMSQVIPFKNYPLSHDDLFCSLLIAYELDTQTCSAKKKMLLENLDVKEALMKHDATLSEEHG